MFADKVIIYIVPHHAAISYTGHEGRYCHQRWLGHCKWSDVRVNETEIRGGEREAATYSNSFICNFIPSRASPNVELYVVCYCNR